MFFVNIFTMFVIIFIVMISVNLDAISLLVKITIIMFVNIIIIMSKVTIVILAFIIITSPAESLSTFRFPVGR